MRVSERDRQRRRALPVFWLFPCTSRQQRGRRCSLLLQLNVVLQGLEESKGETQRQKQRKRKMQEQGQLRDCGTTCGTILGVPSSSVPTPAEYKCSNVCMRTRKQRTRTFALIFRQNPKASHASRKMQECNKSCQWKLGVPHSLDVER